MTDDLVQRLRSHADDWLDGTEGRAMLSGAADLIEHLQADNQRLRMNPDCTHLSIDPPCSTRAEVVALRAEVERLQADNQRMAEVYELAARSAHAASLFQGGAGGRDNPQAVAVHMAEWFEEQEAEVVRLQQALRDLLLLVEARSTHEPPGGVVAAARAVLEGNQQ